MPSKVIADWSERPLGEVATLQRGIDLPVQRRVPGEVPVFGSNGIVGYHKQSPFGGPGVVTGRSGSIGPVYFSQGGYWPLNTTLYVKDFHGNDPQFIARLLTHLRLERFAAATGVPSLNRNFIHPLPVALPPVPEQRRITEVLESLDKTILKTEQLVAKLKQMKQGFLQDLLTRGIDENGELRDPEQHPEHFKESPLGRIPSHWGCVPLGELAEISGGVTLGRSPSGPATVELPYLRVANVQDGYLDLTEVKTIRIFSSEENRFRLEIGDVLMNEGGDFDKLGRGTVWEGQINRCLHQNHVFRVRCKRSVLKPWYLAAASESAVGKSYFVRSSKQTTNLATINSTQIKAFLVPLPPTDEQDRIADVLGAAKRRAETENSEFNKLRLLKKALMDDLLTGRVRVTPLLAEPTP